MSFDPQCQSKTHLIENIECSSKIFLQLKNERLKLWSKLKDYCSATSKSLTNCVIM